MEEVQIRYQNWKENVDEPVLRKELDLLNEQEIQEHFYSTLEFGTSGLRGVLGVGTNHLNIYTVRQLSQAVAEYLNSLKKDGTFAIAYDSRINSELFAHEVARVMAANGIKVYLYKELMPVPSLSYIIRHLSLDMGVMITASHNPSKYNGYKVYGSNGCQISKAGAKQVVENRNHIDEFKDIKLIDFEEGLKNGSIHYIEEQYIQDYINDTLKLTILGNKTKKNAIIVYSPLNGAGRRCITETLKKDGFNQVYVVKEQEFPDGNFPTCPKPNPELHETLSLGIELGKKVNADIVMASDPDSDRMGLAIAKNGQFEFINGNEIGLLIFDFICNAHIQNKDMPVSPCLVKTVVTSNLFYPLAKHYGVEVVESLVGFKSICDHVEELLKQKKSFIFGLEESYGYLSRSDVRDKDAVNAALLIAEMTFFYKDKGINLIDRLAALYDEFGYYESSLVPYEFEGRDGLKRIESIMNEARNGALGKNVFDFNEDNPIGKANMVKLSYEDGSSLLIRPSGTEPKIKFYFETKGKSLEDCHKLTKKYQDMVNDYIKKGSR